MNYLLKVKDNEGNIYTMPSETPKCILEVHYSTSYLQFVIQDYSIDEYGSEIYPIKDIIVPLDTGNWVDMIAIKEDEIGSLVE